MLLTPVAWLVTVKIHVPATSAVCALASTAPTRAITTAFVSIVLTPVPVSRISSSSVRALCGVLIDRARYTYSITA